MDTGCRCDGHRSEPSARAVSGFDEDGGPIRSFESCDASCAAQGDEGILALARAARVRPVESVGAGQADWDGERGQKQLRGKDARALERTLFGLAETGDEGALAILVQLYLGLRPGEVLGLTVGALDGSDVYVDGTKNKNAKRRLELFAPVAELLQRHSDGRSDSQRIFAAHLPQMPTTAWMYKRLQKYCDQAGIERVCPHSLRGLHSSLALEAGATSHDVARSLGHSSFEITKKHYASPESIDTSRLRKIRQALHDS